MNATVRPRSLFRRILRFLLWTTLILLILIVARCLYAFRDRAPGTDLVLNLDDREARSQPRPLRVGFGRVKINPDLATPTGRSGWPASVSTAPPPRSTMISGRWPACSTTATRGWDCGPGRHRVFSMTTC